MVRVVWSVRHDPIPVVWQLGEVRLHVLYQIGVAHQLELVVEAPRENLTPPNSAVRQTQLGD